MTMMLAAVLPLLVAASAEAQQVSDYAEYLKASGLPELYRTELSSACLERCDLDACRELVHHLNSMGRAGDALDLADAIQCEPKRTAQSLLLIKARAHHQAGQYGEAIAILDRLIEELPPKDILVESIFVKAQCQVHEGQVDEARFNLRSIEPHVPAAGRPLYLVYLGVCEEELGNIGEARELYHEAMDGQPDQATLGLLRCSLKEGDIDEFTGLYKGIPGSKGGLIRAVACEHAPDLDVVYPETWRMLLTPVLADTGFTAFTCPEIKASIMRMAESGENVSAYCDALLSRPVAPGAARELRYARALSLADSAGSCDTLLVLSRQAETAAFRFRCIGECMSLALRKGRQGLVTEITPRLAGMVENLRPEERFELARMFVEAGQQSRAAANLEVLLKDLETDYDHSVVVALAGLLEQAGEAGMAASLYEKVAKSPMPSSYSLAAERSARLLERFTPTDLDIAGEVTRAVKRGASDVEMGDLFVDRLKDYERAVEFYRSALDTLPSGPAADDVKMRLAVPLALEGIRTGDEGLRTDALDLVAAVSDTDFVTAARLIDALKLATDWLAVDRQRCFEVIQKISAREDLSSADLLQLSRMLFDLFADRDGNVYAQGVIVLRRLSQEYPTSPEAPLAGVLRARMKFLAGDYVGALEGFQATGEVWRKPPVSELCEIGIGDCYLYSGGASEAAGHYVKAGKHTPALMSLATCHELVGDTESAAAVYREMLIRLLSPSLLKVVKLRLGLLAYAPYASGGMGGRSRGGMVGGTSGGTGAGGTGAADGNTGPAGDYSVYLDSAFPGIRDDLGGVVRILRAGRLAGSGYAGMGLDVLAHETRAGDPDLACDAMLFEGQLAEEVDPESVLEVLEVGETHCADIYGAFRLLRERARHACASGPPGDCSAQAGRFKERFPLDEAGMKELDARAYILMYREGLTDSAAADLDSMLASGSGHGVPPAVIYRHGIQKLVDGEPGDAATVFHLIEAGYPEPGEGGPDSYDNLYYDTCFKLGTTYYLLEKYDSSAAYFELASHSGSATLVENAIFNRALALEEAERSGDAADAFWRHAMTFPFSDRFERSLMRCAFSLEAEGRPEDAIEVYAGLLRYAETAETAAEAMYWTGESYAEMGDEQRAACEFLRVSFMFPDGGPWTGTSAFRAGLECEKAGLEDHALKIYRDNVRRFGTETDWGKASQERLIEIEKEP
jgi:tetratricopeptide (TPR) repeat protein